MNMNKHVQIEIVVNIIKNVCEQFSFAFQFDDAVQRENIMPHQFRESLSVIGTTAPFSINRDWKQCPDDFKLAAKNAMWSIIGGGIMILNQNYRALEIQAEQNRSLYAAQELLRHVRNAFGHMKVHPGGKEIHPYWYIKENNGRKHSILKIDELGICFDEREHHDKKFEWYHIHSKGFVKFLELLDYLVRDLQNRQSNINKNCDL
jgi:hypothetical protein